MPQAYTHHKHSCQKTKKRLTGTFEKAKEVWQVKKHLKREEKAANEAFVGPLSMNSVIKPVPTEVPMSATSKVYFDPKIALLHTKTVAYQSMADFASTDAPDLDQSLAE
jgi:hypothetical protein